MITRIKVTFYALMSADSPSQAETILRQEMEQVAFVELENASRITVQRDTLEVEEDDAWRDVHAKREDGEG